MGEKTKETMKLNYSPWSIRVQDFPSNGTLDAKILFLLRFAVLAPSGHNSQPWVFSVKDSALTLQIDPMRRLPVGDEDDHLLYISMGCFIANLVVAADYYGMKFNAEYFPQLEKGDKERIAVFHFDDQDRLQNNLNRDHLLFSIIGRTTNRHKHTSKELPKTLMVELQKLPGIGEKLSISSDKKLIKEIGHIAVNASIEEMDIPGFRRELSTYVKNNTTKEKFGIPAFGMGIPTIVSYLVPFLLRKINMNRLGRKNDLELFHNFTCGIGIVSTEKDNKMDWINAGILFEHVALVAQKEGVFLSVYASPIILPSYRNELKRVSNISAYPQLLFRIGYPEQNTPHSPRFSVDDKIL